MNGQAGLHVHITPASAADPRGKVTVMFNLEKYISVHPGDTPMFILELLKRGNIANGGSSPSAPTTQLFIRHDGSDSVKRTPTLPAVSAAVLIASV